MSALAGYYAASFEGLPYIPIPIASGYELVLTGQTSETYRLTNFIDSVELYKANGSVFNLTSLVQDASFEDHAPANGFEQNPPSAAWSYAGLAGLAANGSVGQRPTFDGTQTAWIGADSANAPGEVSQVLALPPGIYFLRYAICAYDPSHPDQVLLSAVARLNNTDLLHTALPFAQQYRAYPTVQSPNFRIY